MKDAEMNELVARALRGELSAGEKREFERQLKEDAALREMWRAERALENALGRLPNAPVSSNFTHLVVQQVLQPKAKPSPANSRISIRQILGRLAFGTAAVGLICFGALQQRETMQRKEVAQTVNAFHGAARAMGGEEMPSTEVLSNFEAIQQLSLPAESELDMELLVALQR